MRLSQGTCPTTLYEWLLEVFETGLNETFMDDVDAKWGDAHVAELVPWLMEHIMTGQVTEEAIVAFGTAFWGPVSPAARAVVGDLHPSTPQGSPKMPCFRFRLL